MKQPGSQLARLLAVSMLTLGVGVSGSVQAAAVPTRAALHALLGGPGTLEDFEAFSIGAGGAAVVACDTGNLLTAASTCSGQGPGLIDAGIALGKPAGGNFLWNGAGYFGSPSREFHVGARVGEPLDIDFVTAVDAFGVDLRAFAGFGATAIVDIYAADDTTLLASVAGVALGGTGVPGFFGWEDAGGIGRVSLSQGVWPWSPIIDNLEWGGAAAGVPLPSTLSLMGLGLVLAGTRGRRRCAGLQR